MWLFDKMNITTNDSTRKRVSWVDYGKCFCMLMVILSHTWSYYTGNSNLFLELMKPTRLLVFFFISGYLIKLESFDFKKMMSSICKKLLFPYFVFTIIIWIPKHIVRGDDLAFEAMFLDIFGGYASWFVAALAVAKITFAIILRFTKNLKTIWLICVVLVLGGFVLTDFCGTLPWNANKGLVALFYLAMGLTYKRYEDKLSKKMWLQAILSVVVYFLCVTLDHFVLHKSTYLFNLGVDQVSFVGVSTFVFLSLLGIWMMVSLVKLLPAGIRWMTYIGKNSLTYYYLNTGLLTVLILIMGKVGLGYSGNDWITLGLFLLVVGLLTIISKLIMHFAPWMVGNFNSKMIH